MRRPARFDDRTTPRTSPHDANAQDRQQRRQPKLLPKPRDHGSMAGPNSSQDQTAPIAAGPPSDYGSDFDDDTVTELLSQADRYSQSVASLASFQDLQSQSQQQDPVVQDAPPALQRSVLLKRSIAQSDSCDVPSGISREPQVEIEYSESNRSAFSRTYFTSFDLFPRFQFQADLANTAPYSRTPLT